MTLDKKRQFKVLTNRIADPKDPHKYQENVNWLLGLWDKCECNHNRGFHDKELWSKNGSCTECNCSKFTLKVKSK